MTRALVLVAAGPLFVFGACAVEQMPPQGQQPPRVVNQTHSPDEKTSEHRRPCGGEIPFEPTFLPADFERRPIPGPAPDARLPDRRNQVIVHFSDGKGSAIEIRRPGTLFVELAQSDDAPTINVLGRETSGFGPVEPYGDEFIVQFTYPANAGSRDECALFSLNEYEVSLAELVKTAEGLREIQ